MPTGQSEVKANRATIFQWRSDKGSPDSVCYHVVPHGNGYQVVNPDNAQPIATIKQFEPLPGQFKFWGKVWEWNRIAGTMIVHNYEFATAKNCRSYLNRVIRQTFAGDCEIVGKARGRPAGATAKVARLKRDRARERDRLRAERFQSIAAMVAERAKTLGERLPTELSNDQLIDWLLDRLPE